MGPVFLQQPKGPYLKDQRRRDQKKSFREYSNSKNWTGFLDNRKEMFGFVAEKISKFNSISKEIYTTHLEDVLTAHEPHHYIDETKPCSHEEADTRMYAPSCCSCH